MKYIKRFENINEELLAVSTIGNIVKKKFGVYKSPIWFHIKISNNNGVKFCLLENDWIGITEVNKYLYDIINKKLNLNLVKRMVNVINFIDVEKLCNFLEKIGLNVYKSDEEDNSQVITVSGKMSEHELKDKIEKI